MGEGRENRAIVFFPLGAKILFDFFQSHSFDNQLHLKTILYLFLFTFFMFIFGRQKAGGRGDLHMSGEGAEIEGRRRKWVLHW